MIRRDVRLRREYLKKKALQVRVSKDQAAKTAVRRALETGTALPGSLRKTAISLRDRGAYDDTVTAVDTGVTVDDEYQNASYTDPKVLLTTSRGASTRLMRFAKELRLMIPDCVRVNRGNGPLSELLTGAREAGYSDVVLVHETRGEPDGIVVSHLPHGPTAYFNVSAATLRCDVEKPAPISEARPHLVFDGFTSGSRVGDRVQTILKSLFPAPAEDSERVLTFANREDYISFRHHVFSRMTPAEKAAAEAAAAGQRPKRLSEHDRKGKREIVLREVGPRFEMRPFKIILGLMDARDADVEWQANSFTNTAAKRTWL